MESMDKKVIYGVDTSQKVTTVMVRDAIIKCFLSAHMEVLDESQEFTNMPREEFEEGKFEEIQMRIFNIIKEKGGDPENPTKGDLFYVIERLMEFAQNFRNPEVVEKHAKEIMELMGLI